MIIELDHLVRVQFVDLIGKDLTKKLCWVDQVVWDIPETVVNYIQNAPLNVKVLTFRSRGKQSDDEVRVSCKVKGIIVVWANPPDFVRYLDDPEDSRS